MPMFAYRALTGEGAPAHGVVDSTTRQGAWRVLRDRGLFPTRLEASASAERARRIGTQSRAALLHQLAALLSGGVPLAEALETLEETTPAAVAAALARVQRTVREGVALGAALERETILLDPTECALITAGDAGGTLAETIADLARELQHTAARRSALRTMLVYPAILVVVSLVIVALLVAVVLPEIAALFADRNTALPTSTRLLVGAATALERGWWLLLLLGAGCVLLGTAVWEHPRLRRALDAALLRLPGVGAVLRDAVVARLGRVIARALRAGLPLDAAFDGAIEGIRNRVVRDELRAAHAALTAGVPLRDALARTQAASPILLRLVGTGEETGTLAAALGEVATVHDARVESRLRFGLALLEPTLIVTLAAGVLFIVWAILVPLLTFDPLGPSG